MWYHALLDLRELLPFPHSVDIDRMSPSQMRRMSVRMVQIHKRWLGRVSDPPVIKEAIGGPIRDIKLLPGGKHFVVIGFDGSTILHSTSGGGPAPVMIKSGDAYVGLDELEPSTTLRLQTIETSMNTAYVLYHIRSIYRYVLAL